jgi:uncharacterized membrane protein YeaQ/YmgE (transglycosylase-associated protein family)
LGRPAACHRSGCRKLGLLGLIAGVLGKLIMPGRDPGCIIVTIPIGMAGAVVGGFVVGFRGGTGATGFDIWSILVVKLGSIVLLALYRLIAGRRALAPPARDPIHRVAESGHYRKPCFRHRVLGTRASGKA